MSETTFIGKAAFPAELRFVADGAESGEVTQAIVIYERNGEVFMSFSEGDSFRLAGMAAWAAQEILTRMGDE